jgi:hypothetical protein
MTTNYGKYFKHLIWIAIVGINACSPVYRFNRLVKRHPYLIDRIKSDTIIINSGKSIDTFFVSEVETDTFYINSGIRIERSRDTFRFIYRERNCTTYIEKTEIRPTTVIEREIRKEIKRDRNRELAIVSLYVFLVLLAIGLLRKLFIK